MKVDVTKVLAWDIETVPHDDFTTEHPMFSCWKNKWRKEALSDEDLIAKYYKEAGLFAEYSRIACISCGFLHEGEIRLKTFTGTEQEIIDGFLATAVAFEGKRKGIVSLGHNILDFDIPYVRKAFARYHPMFEFPLMFSDIGQKPWTMEEKVLDTLKLHKGTSFMFASMAEVAGMLGLPSPKTDTDGSMVADLFRKGELQRIATYCEGDVYTTWCILWRWLTMDELPKRTVVKEVNLPEVPLLNKLVSTGTLSEKEKVRLRNNVKKLGGEENTTVALILNTIRTVIPTFTL